MDRSIALCVVPLLTVFACGDPDPSSTSAADEPSADTAPAPSAPIGDRVVGTTTILRSGFEDASPKCNDWTSVGSSSIRSIPSRSGDYACKVCSTGAVPQLVLAHATGAIEPGHYTLTAWVRRRAPSPAVAHAVLEAETAGGKVTHESAPAALVDDYVLLTAEMDLAEPATTMRVRIQASADATECLLVDDVTVLRR